jgi:hypothetical protein
LKVGLPWDRKGTEANSYFTPALSFGWPK